MSLRFVASSFDTPSTALVPGDKGESDLVYIRFTEEDGNRIAYLPGDAEEVFESLKRMRNQGSKFARVIIVGADCLFEPGRMELMGREDALTAFAALMTKLAHERIPFLWRTRAGITGIMPRVLSEALTDAASMATVEIGLASLDPNLNMTLEGRRGTAPESRLRLASAASARGVPVRGLIDPLVPVLTDQSTYLINICTAFADAGIHKVSVRYLVLTRARAKALTRRLSRMMRDLVKGCFASESWRKPEPMAITHSHHEAHKLLPANLRRAGHERVMDIAASLGLTAQILDPVKVDQRRYRDGKRSAKKKKPALVSKPQLDLFSRKTG